MPLRCLYPQADVPVFKVSLPASLDGASAYAFGQALAPLADEGVLIVGSGILTHNLGEVRFEAPLQPPSPYVRDFVDWVEQTLRRQDHTQLVQVLTQVPHARRTHPTTEHLWPLLVT